VIATEIEQWIARYQPGQSKTDQNQYEKIDERSLDYFTHWPGIPCSSKRQERAGSKLPALKHIG
jgi:hypothetical protein